ncbi:velvet factor [Phycomyces nitens]|nr:velvet factor [Phycomyces nitens]
MDSFALSDNKNSNQPIEHYLSVIQEPIRARSCGFGEKDRRPIDPPPILRLEILTRGSLEESQRTTLFLLVQCELMDENRVKSCNLVSIPISRSLSNVPPVPIEESGKPVSGLVQLQQPERARNLTGSTHSNAYHLKDDENCQGIFFIFNDLSVRTEGVYSLKFTLIDVCPREFNGVPSGVLGVAFSAPFTVYPPKKFPGMTGKTRINPPFQGICQTGNTDCHTKGRSF